jgi:hypothetical protein
MLALRKFNQPPPPPPPSPLNSESVRLRSNLQELADRWECSPEIVAISLKRATDWDTRNPHLELDEFLMSTASDNSLIRRIRDLVQRSPGACLAFIETDHPAQVTLRDLLGAGGEDQARKLRQSLFECWQAFEKVRNTPREVADLVEEADVSSKGFGRTISFLRNRTVTTGRDNGFTVPTTPIFDRQDVLIVELIEGIFRDGAAQGLSDALEQSQSVEILSQPNLTEKLRRLATRKENIYDAVVEEGKNVVWKVGEKPKSYYQSLGAFLKCLEQITSMHAGSL